MTSVVLKTGVSQPHNPDLDPEGTMYFTDRGYLIVKTTPPKRTRHRLPLENRRYVRIGSGVGYSSDWKGFWGQPRVLKSGDVVEITID